MSCGTGHRPASPRRVGLRADASTREGLQELRADHGCADADEDVRRPKTWRGEAALAGRSSVAKAAKLETGVTGWNG